MGRNLRYFLGDGQYVGGFWDVKIRVLAGRGLTRSRVKANPVVGCYLFSETCDVATLLGARLENSLRAS